MDRGGVGASRVRAEGEGTGAEQPHRPRTHQPCGRQCRRQELPCHRDRSADLRDGRDDGIEFAAGGIGPVQQAGSGDRDGHRHGRCHRPRWGSAQLRGYRCADQRNGHHRRRDRRVHLHAERRCPATSRADIDARHRHLHRHGQRWPGQHACHRDPPAVPGSVGVEFLGRHQHRDQPDRGGDEPGRQVHLCRQPGQQHGVGDRQRSHERHLQHRRQDHYRRVLADRGGGQSRRQRGLRDQPQQWHRVGDRHGPGPHPRHHLQHRRQDDQRRLQPDRGGSQPGRQEGLRHQPGQQLGVGNRRQHQHHHRHQPRHPRGRPHFCRQGSHWRGGQP